jgi:hypothetical protein
VRPRGPGDEGDPGDGSLRTQTSFPRSFFSERRTSVGNESGFADYDDGYSVRKLHFITFSNFLIFYASEYINQDKNVIAWYNISILNIILKIEV